MALYDPREFPETKTDFTLADVLAWARTKPANEEYQFLNSSMCAVAQFGIETRRPYLIAVDDLTTIDPILCDVAVEGDWTFGAFADRLEKKLAK